jgi:hypothetical protein
MSKFTEFNAFVPSDFAWLNPAFRQYDDSSLVMGVHLYIECGDRVFVHQERESKPYTLPGGKIERGENVIQCLERELKEEGFSFMLKYPFGKWDYSFGTTHLCVFRHHAVKFGSATYLELSKLGKWYQPRYSNHRYCTGDFETQEQHEYFQVILGDGRSPYSKEIVDDIFNNEPFVIGVDGASFADVSQAVEEHALVAGLGLHAFFPAIADHPATVDNPLFIGEWRGWAIMDHDVKSLNRILDSYEDLLVAPWVDRVYWSVIEDLPESWDDCDVYQDHNETCKFYDSSVKCIPFNCEWLATLGEYIYDESHFADGTGCGGAWDTDTWEWVALETRSGVRVTYNYWNDCSCHPGDETGWWRGSGLKWVTVEEYFLICKAATSKGHSMITLGGITKLRCAEALYLLKHIRFDPESRFSAFGRDVMSLIIKAVKNTELDLGWVNGCSYQPQCRKKLTWESESSEDWVDIFNTDF